MPFIILVSFEVTEGSLAPLCDEIVYHLLKCLRVVLKIMNCNRITEGFIYTVSNYIEVAHLNALILLSM